MKALHGRFGVRYGQIEESLIQFNDKVDLSCSPLPQPKHLRHKPQGNEPAFDLRTHLYRISGVDFTLVDGLGVLTVRTILSEVGLDPSRFPTVKHFTSWLGLCPGHSNWVLSLFPNPKQMRFLRRAIVNLIPEATTFSYMVVNFFHLDCLSC